MEKDVPTHSGKSQLATGIGQAQTDTRRHKNIEESNDNHQYIVWRQLESAISCMWSTYAYSGNEFQEVHVCPPSGPEDAHLLWLKWIEEEKQLF